MKKIPDALPILFIVLLALSAAPARAQFVSLTGRVVDQSGAGIAGATVSVYERDGRNRVSTVTKADGSYRFERASVGERLVEVSAQGFTRATKAVRINGGGETIDFSLSVAGINR
jgi:hypothetical protein